MTHSLEGETTGTTHMPNEIPYDPALHVAGDAEIAASAAAVVPLVQELVNPASVVDVGCGLGRWLAEFRRAGVPTILGIDGDYVRRDALLIPADRFMAADLEAKLPDSGWYDLAVSLEVAEHLRPARAPGFVEELTRLAPAVLFSAAVPFQGGVNHFNEQWQDYWAGLFGKHGYVPVDCVRWRVWDDQRVVYHYRQNTLLYVEQSHLASHPRLALERERAKDFPLVVAHPFYYLRAADPRNRGLREVLRLLPRVGWAAVKRRWARLRGRRDGPRPA